MPIAMLLLLLLPLLRLLCLDLPTCRRYSTLAERGVGWLRSESIVGLAQLSQRHVDVVGVAPSELRLLMSDRRLPNTSRRR